MKMIRMVALAGGFAALAVPSVLGADVRLTPPAEGAREVVTVDPKGANRVVVKVDVPYVAYFNTAGRNAFSIGSASLGWDTQIGSKINQEKGVWEVTMTVVASPGAN